MTLLPKVRACCARLPEVWLQLSTMATYGDTGDTVLDERVPRRGSGRARWSRWRSRGRPPSARWPRRCRARCCCGPGSRWEATTTRPTARLRQLVRLGLAGPVAGGRQWVSWVALDDLLAILLRALDHPETSGTYLATAPEPVTNTEKMRVYRRLLGRRVGLPSPGPLTRMSAWLMGSDPALALTGRRGIPRRLLDEGFDFSTTSFEEAARAALERPVG